MIRSKTALAHGVEWVWQGATPKQPQVSPRHWEHTPGVTYPAPATPEAAPPAPTLRTITHTPPPAAEWATIDEISHLYQLKVSTARSWLWQAGVRTSHCPPRTYYHRADSAAAIHAKQQAKQHTTPPPGWLTIDQARAALHCSRSYIRHAARTHRIRTIPKPHNPYHSWYNADDISHLPTPKPRGRTCTVRARNQKAATPKH